ncbi:mannosylinositol phosphorylceramide synthase regulatory subunit SCDLUD_002403 [Saccharomycodes ludwigii]|uniref:mannosylinositol phosphorylceramide synthase regulatory subunit n=1 Tax=Saccharomycodes ludwigii TaxID=36035 RepID=UPI001E878271|nr:hypothetical protein SCDLUD_002403 [Saccharomycodes ludwigii]KAH3900942.1 hypothetical protein SCDLUD_002403 [Saccharomycodes ludwigii]
MFKSRLLWFLAVFSYAFMLKLLYLSYVSSISVEKKNATGTAAVTTNINSKVASGDPNTKPLHANDIKPLKVLHDPLYMTFLFQSSWLLIFPIMQLYNCLKYRISPNVQFMLCLHLHRIPVFKNVQKRNRSDSSTTITDTNSNLSENEFLSRQGSPQQLDDLQSSERYANIHTATLNSNVAMEHAQPAVITEVVGRENSDEHNIDEQIIEEDGLSASNANTETIFNNTGNLTTTAHQSRTSELPILEQGSSSLGNSASFAHLRALEEQLSKTTDRKSRETLHMLINHYSKLSETVTNNEENLVKNNNGDVVFANSNTGGNSPSNIVAVAATTTTTINGNSSNVNNNDTSNNDTSTTINSSTSDNNDTDHVNTPDAVTTPSKFAILNSFQIIRSLTISLLMSAATYCIFIALPSIPLSDLSIMSNLSVFEICNLLFAFTGIARLKTSSVNRNNNSSSHRPSVIANPSSSLRQIWLDFAGICFCIISVVIITSQGQGTGSLNDAIDPYVFDRLAGCLISGLGCLTIGPCCVIWFKYIYPQIVVLEKKNKRIFNGLPIFISNNGDRERFSLPMRANDNDLMTHTTSISTCSGGTVGSMHSRHVRKIWQNILLSLQASIIGLVNFISLGLLLLIRYHYNQGIKSATSGSDAADTGAANISSPSHILLDPKLIFSILFGYLPFIIAIIQLTLYESAGYASTICLGNILCTAIVEWIFNNNTTNVIVVTKGEAAGYLFLAIGLCWMCCTYKKRTYY